MEKNAGVGVYLDSDCKTMSCAKGEFQVVWDPSFFSLTYLEEIVNREQLVLCLVFVFRHCYAGTFCGNMRLARFL